MPELIGSIRELRAALQPLRHREKSIGLVPTMGALHAGHRRLLEIARRENDAVIASIFVNPLQFDRPDDLERYPRTIDRDVDLCGNAGVDFVFAPAASEMYPEEMLTTVDVRILTDTLCGPHRPGHFRGVAAAVLKLFEIVQPNRAYFGEKDAQQLAVISRMVEDLNVPVEVVPVATVREPDGLALSSRNQLLTERQRELAPILYRALAAAQKLVEGGESSTETILHSVQPMLACGSEVRLEYFDIVDPRTLVTVRRIVGPVLIAGAMWLDQIRIIDNVRAKPPDVSPRNY